MLKTLFLACAACASLATAGPAAAGERYGSPPPVVVSPDLSAPWVMQLQRAPVGARHQRNYRNLPAGVTVRVAPPAKRAVRQRPATRQATVDRQVRTAAYAVRPLPSQPRRTVNPLYLPQDVAYDGGHKPGTIVIDTDNKFLYLVTSGGMARRYGVGVAKPGFEWAGTHKITLKREWPDWRPPAEMIERVKRQEGRILPVHMPGGPANPLGARALYLGSTLYRIHGTNAPWTIGQNVSSGCIRMRNEDVIDLYNRVGVGTRVIVQ
ncbi:MAG: L,D-transpeptidase [Zhengella sp.]|uniref:L,D-transpeptidase n=1 Tax=Zhengella sp. TaxID=2282762 RepID=UPI0035297A1F|nr:L,D-transpeptidase [Brucellaceae bacterium]